MHFKKNNESGFTLIEMITVILIFGIVSLIVMLNFRTFSARVSFNNLVQDIALRIVQAQKDAVNGALNPNFLGQDVKVAYGMYFETNSSSGTTTKNTQFTYFADQTISSSPYNSAYGNKMYDTNLTGGDCVTPLAAGHECIAKTVMNTGEYINQICYHYGSGHSCGTTSDTAVHIVFTRPNPDASILIQNLSGTTPVAAGPVCIGVVSPNDSYSQRTIMITSLGQIGVYNLPANSTTAPVSACNS